MGQIEVFKTLNQIGHGQKALDEIPERLEILASNCAQAIEQCEVLIKLNKVKITEHGRKIHDTGEKILELRTTLAALSKLSKEHARVINQGNTMQENRLAHIHNEVEIKTGIYNDKREKYQNELNFSLLQGIEISGIRIFRTKPYKKKFPIGPSF